MDSELLIADGGLEKIKLGHYINIVGHLRGCSGTIMKGLKRRWQTEERALTRNFRNAIPSLIL